MNVYVIFKKNNYKGTEIAYIFKNKKDAENLYDKIFSDDYDDAWIEEHKLIE